MRHRLTTKLQDLDSLRKRLLKRLANVDSNGREAKNLITKIKFLSDIIERKEFVKELLLILESNPGPKLTKETKRQLSQLGCKILGFNAKVLWGQKTLSGQATSKMLSLVERPRRRIHFAVMDDKTC